MSAVDIQLPPEVVEVMMAASGSDPVRAHGSFTLEPPQTKQELQLAIWILTGYKIPDVQVCPNHVSPMEALWQSYKADYLVTIWLASRGLAGKSLLAALCALACAVFQDAEGKVLGGSGAQSLRVQEYLTGFWSSPVLPGDILDGNPSSLKMKLVGGGEVGALMASQRSVRGPHPQRLFLDEADEMEESILNAALGQPMEKGDILPQVTISSTHHRPNGTVTELLKRASDEPSWKVMSWCWRESLQPHGWLSMAEVERKKSLLPARMFNVEIDMEEPTSEGAAFDPEAVERMFVRELGEHKLRSGELLVIEEPQPGGEYATGADWAQTADKTVIATIRTNPPRGVPMYVVAYEEVNRRPWPEMVARLNRRLDRYGPKCCHDATGLGSVVADLLTHQVEDFTFAGRKLDDLYSEYVAAVEHDEVACPYIESVYLAHKYAEADDLWGPGHCPDEVAAMALAYRATKVEVGTTFRVRS